jgi:hypothetical protein
VDAELPRLVGCGGHHAAAVAGKAADNDGLPPVFGVVKLFYRGVEGVKVGVDEAGRINKTTVSG